MNKNAALVMLLAAWGVGASLPTPVGAQSAPATEVAQSPADALVDRVWVRTDQDDLPGGMKIFLSDGTLVSDSCWETHRLSSWARNGETGLTWDEDGATISAEITSLGEAELVLTLALGADKVEERYAPATVPYVCPDMPR